MNKELAKKEVKFNGIGKYHLEKELLGKFLH